jgi:hypothetical protein
MIGGLTFADAAPMLCTVVDNGIDPSDPRVMVRANEATKIALDYLIPVGGMSTFDVTADGTTLWLPPDLENVIEAEVVDDKTTVRGSSDVAQAWYQLISQSDYVDPMMAMDNPLVDLGLFPDTDNPRVLRRKYDYPGLTPNAVVRVTGAKRFLPIVNQSDYLIVQNLEALKLIILSIERYENNSPDDAQKYRQVGLELLQAEVKKHLLDPMNSMKRKAGYEDDMVTFLPGTMAWTRARIALEVPTAMSIGKKQLTRILEIAEMRLMEIGIFRGTLKEYTAEVTGGVVLFPKDVLTVVAVDLSGHPIDIRSQFFQYQQNGPGMFHHCHPSLIDQGEEVFPSGNVRRKYRLTSTATNTRHLSAVCKLRWIAKAPTDQMVITNFDALAAMVTGIILERREQWQESILKKTEAVKILQDELTDYLRGIKHTMNVDVATLGFESTGHML